MSRSVALFWILFFAFTIVCKAKSPIDSLESVLRSAQEDTIRVHLLNELSDRYLAYMPEKARQYAQEALDLSGRLKFTRGEVVALNNGGKLEVKSEPGKGSEFCVTLRRTSS